MNLFVKWGQDMRIEEGQTLYALRHSLGSVVPIPEIYGWHTDGEQVFLYMEAIRGKTLEECWPTMHEDNRLDVCRELRTMLDAVRQLKQEPNDPFIGKPSWHYHTRRSD